MIGFPQCQKNENNVGNQIFRPRKIYPNMKGKAKYDQIQLQIFAEAAVLGRTHGVDIKVLTFALGLSDFNVLYTQNWVCCLFQMEDIDDINLSYGEIIIINYLECLITPPMIKI